MEGRGDLQLRRAGSMLQLCWAGVCSHTKARRCAHPPLIYQPPRLLLPLCRFPDGESGSDVYNRVSIFEDHLIRDMKASRFSSTTSLCLVTHGLTMRVFLMRWFNWTVESFL